MKHFNQSDNLDTVFKGMFSLPRGMWRAYIYSFQKGNCHQIRFASQGLASLTVGVCDFGIYHLVQAELLDQKQF